MNHLLFQAYGNKDNLHECLYSLYSLADHKCDCQIVIYTDQENYLKDRIPPSLDISYQKID